MLLIWILLHYVWFLDICILDLSIYYNFKSIILFFLSKKKKVSGNGLFFFKSAFYPKFVFEKGS